MTKLSAVITCFNNENTISQCIKSLSFADEIIVLDSFSTDATLSLLKQHDCILHQQKFKGYAQQKQDAINLARHDWVILLDSDEHLSISAQEILKAWLKTTPKADAYALPRQEWVFWKWSHSWVHMSKIVRLFNQKKAKISQALVHESVKSNGKIAKLNAVIKHFSDTSISKKIDKINHYSQLIAQQRFELGRKVNPLKLIFYPPWFFLSQLIFKRHILNGWAGFVYSVVSSKYVFLKYAKLYGYQKQK